MGVMYGCYVRVLCIVLYMTELCTGVMYCTVHDRVMYGCYVQVLCIVLYMTELCTGVMYGCYVLYCT